MEVRSYKLQVAGELVASIAPLLAQNNALQGPEQMAALIKLVGDADAAGRTEQELVVTALMATVEAPLLESFSHSAAERAERSACHIRVPY